MPSLNGITTQEEELRGCHVTTLDVQTEDAAASLGKAVGSYITIDTAALSDEHEQIECAGECLAEILVRVLTFMESCASAAWGTESFLRIRSGRKLQADCRST